MNSVYLDSKYNEYVVDDEAYQQIEAIVQANKHCLYDYQNRHRYTAENPCVGKSNRSERPRGNEGSERLCRPSAESL